MMSSSGEKESSFLKKVTKDPLKVACKAAGGMTMVSGGIKLFKMSDDIHKSMKRSFKDMAGVFPLAPLGIVPDYKMYKHVWGAAEIGCGTMLVFGKNKNKRKGCVGLVILQLLATQAKISLGEYPGALCHALAGLVIGAMYVALKVEDNELKKQEEGNATKNE